MISNERYRKYTGKLPWQYAYVRTDGRTDGWTDGRADGWTDTGALACPVLYPSF